jgi:hypothetical protein
MKKLLFFTFVIFFVLAAPLPLFSALPVELDEEVDQPLPEPGKVVRPPHKPGKPAPAIPQPPPPPPDPSSLISEKNLFRPDRKDWVMDDATAMGKDRGQKKEKPKLQLFGTMVIGDQKKAIIRMPQPARGMANREVYSPGDYIGEYVLQEVDEERAVLDYYGEKVTLLLHEGKVRPKGDKTEIETPEAVRVAAPAVKGRQLTPEQEAKRKEIMEVIEKAKRGIKPPPEPGPDGLIRINPFMSREERRSAIEHNRRVLAERRSSAGQ